MGKKSKQQSHQQSAEAEVTKRNGSESPEKSKKQISDDKLTPATLREKYFPTLHICQIRCFKPRNTVLTDIILTKKSSHSSLRGFVHLFIATCVFYGLTHPLIYYNRTGNWFNLSLYNSFKDEFFFVISMWPIFTLWSYHAFLLQKMLQAGVPLFLLKIYQHLTQTLMFAGGIWICFAYNLALSHSMFLLFQSCIHFFKMHSYTETNILLRREAQLAKEKGVKCPSPYPNNVTLKDYTYFLCTPVMVYWYEYPKLEGGIRWKRFFIHSFYVMMGLIGIYIITCESLIPIFEKPFSYSMVEAIATMIIPQTFVNFLIFYTIWENLLQAEAELTRFADRKFYEDWWNSTTFEEFNRKWNRIIHEFLYRHAYLYTINELKWSKNVAQFLTFVFSACLHEMIIAVCLQRVQMHLFWFMLIQIPLIKLGSYMKDTDFGNYLFLCGIQFGVPLITCFYNADKFNGIFFRG